MRPIRDYEDKVVCYADELTGYVESKKGKNGAMTYLPVGSEITFVRGRTKTIVRRTSEQEIEVLRYLAA